MEIDVTKYVHDYDCSQFSDSIANSGLQNIGEITWRNACAEAGENPLVASEQQDELRDWIREFGAWTSEEIANMSDQETNALLLQFIAGDIREMEDHFPDLESYEQACQDGITSGRLYPDEREQKWYFYC